MDEAEIVYRAKLKAKFTKAASKADSKWEVYADDKLILSATGKDIYEENDKGKEGLDLADDFAAGGIGLEHLVEKAKEGAAHA